MSMSPIAIAALEACAWFGTQWRMRQFALRRYAELSQHQDL